jgi:hypothetical protein
VEPAFAKEQKQEKNAMKRNHDEDLHVRKALEKHRR